MAERTTLEKIGRFGKAVFGSGLTDFIPGGTLAGNLAKVAGRVLGVDDPDDVADLIEKGLPADQAGKIREAMAREVEAYEATEQERERTKQAKIAGLTERHRNDMLSKSKLAQNWRQIVGYVILSFFLLDHITWRVCGIIGREVEPSQNLYNMAWAVIAFYFGGQAGVYAAAHFAEAMKKPKES